MTTTQPYRPGDDELRLGGLALREGLVTVEQLMQALSIQAQEAKEGKLPRKIGIILLSGGLISEEQLENLLEKQIRLRTGQGPGAGDRPNKGDLLR